MKIIFLDVDGVLNNRKAFKQGKKDGFPHGVSLVWDPDCVDRLNKIIEKTGAKIVVSSTWRLYDDAYKVLIEVMGIKGEFIGCTPDHMRMVQDSCRGNEISEWMKENKEEGPIVILDDDSDMEGDDSDKDPEEESEEKSEQQQSWSIAISPSITRILPFHK